MKLIPVGHGKFTEVDDVDFLYLVVRIATDIGTTTPVTSVLVKMVKGLLPL